jgi:PTS system fructose-specific IIA component/PTS system nitrogen regulatory IIA component
LWFPALAGVESLDFLVGGGLIHELRASTKSEVFESLVRKLCDLGYLRPHDVDSVVQSLMQRERLGSTGIGRGIAVPHAKHAAVERIVGILGHVAAGIEFDSLDGAAVMTVCLVLSPPDQPGNHLRALEKISRVLRTAA